MNEKALSLAKDLQTMKASDVIRDERVKAQFINTYNAIWKEGGEGTYEKESLYFIKALRDSDALRACTAFSVYYSFIDLAVRGLSLAPGSQALCYLLPRNQKAGKRADGSDIWEKVCALTISGFGELTLRARAGQIRCADNPTIVYDGDKFEYGERDGKKIVNYMSAFPRKSNKIVACFIKITRADGSIDYSVMTEPDWARLQDYSTKNNSYFDRKKNEWIYKTNELYSSANGGIDPGFLAAKCIKHAFKSYPKINIGKGTVMESDIDANQPADFDPYGGVAEQPKPQPAMPKRQESFAPEPDMSDGVAVDPEEYDDNDGCF